MTQETPVTENQTPSPASEFKKRSSERNEARAITLPSGLVVLCKRPSITQLIKTGIVPTDVASVLMSGDPNSKGVDAKQMPKLLKLQAIIATHSVVSPVISENPTEDEVSVDDFEDEDLAAIMAYVQEGVEALQSFRSESEQ